MLHGRLKLMISHTKLSCHEFIIFISKTFLFLIANY